MSLQCKELTVPQIRPIKVLRNTTEISELCHKIDEPVFISKNGYGDLVIMSMETYEKQLAKLDVYKKLTESEAQIKNKEDLLDTKEVFAELKAKYGKQ
jgi:PHD/YefM family antitoxin component YafN of YafNO toxin-antitoxin module